MTQPGYRRTVSVSSSAHHNLQLGFPDLKGLISRPTSHSNETVNCSCNYCRVALPMVPTDASAPSVQEIQKLYGEPTMERFAVRNGITVAVAYGPDRAACQILIAPRRLLVEVRSPDSLTSSPDVSRVPQELLSPFTRGRRINSNSIQVDGNTLLKTHYEKLSIRRICSSQSCISSSENQDLRSLVARCLSEGC